MKILIDEEVVKQALDALDKSIDYFESHDKEVQPYVEVHRSITTLRSALQADTKVEPVAWTTMPDANEWTFVSGSQNPNGKLDGTWHPLYAEPLK
jgi:hypothetical protein